MRNPTDLSKAILTSPTAQKIIDYISPVYGNSYVGLWILQAIGTVFDDVVEMANQLRSEGNPVTSTLLIDLWEQQYALPKDNSLTLEQRQARLAAKSKSRGPCNPERLAAAVSAAIGGIEVRIHENVAPNTFLVEIQDYIPSILPVVAVLERKKPAHLVYEIRFRHLEVSETDLKTAIALVRAEKYKVEVQQ